MNFPVLPTPAGPCHSFLDMALEVAPPLRLEMQEGEAQEFVAQPTLFSTTFSAPKREQKPAPAASLGPLFGG